MIQFSGNTLLNFVLNFLILNTIGFWMYNIAYLIFVRRYKEQALYFASVSHGITSELKKLVTWWLRDLSTPNREEKS
jgi:hypothetical protein